MAIVANRAGSKRRLLRVFLCVAPALLAGCGSPFEEGDEAWIHVPGEVLFFDEYIVVEVDRFADRRVEVVPWRINDYRKSIAAKAMDAMDEYDGLPREYTGRLVLRLEAADRGGSAYVDADELINPDEAEDAYEAKAEILKTFMKAFEGDLLDFIANEADIEEFEAALETAESLDVDEAAVALRMLIETMETLSDVVDEEVDEESALDALKAYRQWVDGIREIVDDEDDWYKPLSKIESPREFRFTLDRPALMNLPFGTVASVFRSARRMADRAPRPFGGDSELDDMIAYADALLKLHESVFLLVTMDGKRKVFGERLKKLTSRYQYTLAQEIGAALVDSIDVKEAASLDSIVDAYAELKETAKKFRDELDLKLLTPETEIRLHERAAGSFNERIELALEGNDFDGAAAAIREYMNVHVTLATLYVRHEKSELQAPDLKAHLAEIGERLASRLAPDLREGALAIAAAAAQDGDQPAAVVERIKEWAAPFNSALGRDVLDEAFLRDVREQGELAVRRGAIQAGQVWSGWIQCQEAAELRRYKDNSGSRGALYHGVDRMAAKLELLEAEGGDLALVRIQGLLTAQNLPDRNKWRQWDSVTEAWMNSEKVSSSQFVVLTYRPALMTASLDYGVLDRRKHVKKYGPSDHWVGEVNGTWYQFRGNGSIDLDARSINGKMTRRYVDDTCRTFRFTLVDGEEADDSLPRPEAGVVSPSTPSDDSPSGLGPSRGAVPSASEALPTEGPPSGLTSETYIGGVKSRGLQMHGLSANGDWCAEKVVFKIKAQSADVFTDGTAKFFVKRFGEQINQPQYCPFARMADIYGYAAGDQLVFTGTASASDGWTVQ